MHEMITYTASEFRSLNEHQRAHSLAPRDVQILSDSMEPVLRVGARYRLELHSVEDLRRFDILVFWNGRFLVAHYVWHINRDVDRGQIITRSLNGWSEDLPIAPQHIVGKIVDVSIPWWRKVLLSIWKH